MLHLQRDHFANERFDIQMLRYPLILKATDLNTEKPFKRGQQYLNAKHVNDFLDNENKRNYFVKKIY